jgi:hypothetical protein
MTGACSTRAPNLDKPTGYIIFSHYRQSESWKTFKGRKKQNLPDFGELPQKGEAPHVPGEHRREVEEGELVLSQQRQVNPALLQQERL